MTVTTEQRTKIHQLAFYLYQHRLQMNYPWQDVRGAADAATWKLATERQMRAVVDAGKHLTFDCSQSVTQILRWAGLADCNGLEYRYPGYTGTMLHFLKHYSDPSLAYVGALCVFGPGTGDHVSMVVERGHDPLMWSHGHAGVDFVRLSVERQYHRSPVTLLSIQKL